MKINMLLFGIIVSIISGISCKKSAYLNAKPNDELVVPETMEDFQAILDNETIMNGAAGSSELIPSLGLTGGDEYYLINGAFQSSLFGVKDKKQYFWENDVFDTNGDYNWSLPYRAIFYSNIVLDGLIKNKFEKFDKNELNNLKGSALFFRAHMFYQLSQVFAPIYNSGSSKSDLGIPLKLFADVNESVKRNSIDQTYQQIINDLNEALDLLPLVAKYKTRPSRPAASGLLARVYLAMQNYDEALKYADGYLKMSNELLDYNEISTLPSYKLNKEVVFQSLILGTILINSSRSRIDSNLYKQYNSADLRRSLFFTVPNSTGVRYRSSYNGTSNLWGGIATDEIYLIRAECYARKGMLIESLSDLNTLLRKRWNKNFPYIPFNSSSAKEVIDRVLLERRKELIFRGLRWTDLRRLNKEGTNITLNRTLDGQSYSLQPNDLKYTFLIPPNVLAFHPDWIQNPR